jgi:hypothetical protein
MPDSSNEYQDDYSKLNGLVKALDYFTAIDKLTESAQKGQYGPVEEYMKSLDSFPEQVKAMQAMAADSKFHEGLPALEVRYDASKSDATLTVGLMAKQGFLSFGDKLIFSETYNPREQKITPWVAPSEK